MGIIYLLAVQHSLTMPSIAVTHQCDQIITMIYEIYINIHDLTQ